MKRNCRPNVLIILLVLGGCESFFEGHFGKIPQRPPPPRPLPPMPPSTRTSSQGQVNDGEIAVPMILVDGKPLVRITFGSPAEKADAKDQEFSVYINLAKGDFWLPSDYLTEKLDRKDLTFRMYSKDKSRTGTRNPLRREQIIETEFEVRGFCSFDVFKIGGGGKVIQLENQGFLEVDQIVRNFGNYDGMLGLGFSTDSECVTPLILSLEKKSQMDPIFGIYINKAPNSKEFGSLVFGGNDDGLMKKQPKAHDIVKNGKMYSGWSIRIDKFVVIRRDGGRTDVALPAENIFTLSPEVEDITLEVGTRNAVYDLMFSNAAFDHVNGHFQGMDKWDTLPDVAFVIGGEEYVMTPQDYVWCQGHKCRSTFTRAKPTMFLGRPFMTKFYTKFDVRKKQILIAESSGLY